MSDKEQEFFEHVGSEAGGGGVQRRPPPGRLNGLPAYNDASPEAPPKPILNENGSSWASSGEMFWRVGKSHSSLPSGVYRMGHAQGVGSYFSKVKNETDKLILFPDSESSNLLDEIKRFQGMKEKFKEHGFLHKRGVLMWGPPGSGKTTTLQWLIKLMVDDGGGIAVFIEHPYIATECLQMLRQVEPDRQVIGIMEDIDSLIHNYGESAYLALLDGESQVDNVVYVATTNYPERLDKRFVDRPSRFDTIRYIGMPSRAARETYFRAKIAGASDTLISDLVNASDDYSVAHMRELIILTQCFEVSVDEAKKRLDKTRKRAPNSNRAPDAPAFGFASAG